LVAQNQGLKDALKDAVEQKAELKQVSLVNEKENLQHEKERKEAEKLETSRQRRAIMTSMYSTWLNTTFSYTIPATNEVDDLPDLDETMVIDRFCYVFRLLYLLTLPIQIINALQTFMVDFSFLWWFSLFPTIIAFLDFYIIVIKYEHRYFPCLYQDTTEKEEDEFRWPELHYDKEVEISYKLHATNLDDLSNPSLMKFDLRSDNTSLADPTHSDPFLCHVTRTKTIDVIHGCHRPDEYYRGKKVVRESRVTETLVIETRETVVSLEYVVQLLGGRNLDYGRSFEEARTNFQQVSGRIQTINLDKIRAVALAIIPNSVDLATAIFCHHKQEAESNSREFPRSHPV